jgi:hypothetical protein
MTPHEGSLPSANIEADRPEFRATAAKFNRALRDVTYVSCWMLREDESDAMWKLYCGNHQGVAIRTTYEKLAAAAASQPSMYLGKVTYVDFEKTLIQMETSSTQQCTSAWPSCTNQRCEL